MDAEMDMTACDNIIYVDFKRGAVVDLAGMDLLDLCMAILSEDDYADLLDAIADPDFYHTCDPDIQALVDGYYGGMDGP